MSAEGGKPLNKGSIPKPATKTDEVLNGKVVRPLRSVNPDQADYCGLIAHKDLNDGSVLGEFEFGIASLLNKKELLQEGDPVSFQVSAAENFALNVKSNKQKLRSHVEAVKGEILTLLTLWCAIYTFPFRTIWIPFLRAGRGQEAVLPHVRG